MFGVDAFGRMVAPRWHLEIAGELRAAPATTAPDGRVSALGLGGGVSLFVRVVGGRRASLAVGAGAAASWLSFRAEASPGAESLSYAGPAGRRAGARGRAGGAGARAARHRRHRRRRRVAKRGSEGRRRGRRQRARAAGGR
jgi:hypothetical protein